MLREVFLLPILLPFILRLMPEAWWDIITAAATPTSTSTSAIATLREAFLFLLLMILMPGAWWEITKAAGSSIAMLREVFLLLLLLLLAALPAVTIAISTTHILP